jgi:hypothetical protein
VLAHEIGDAVFNVDKDGKIDQSDATAGVIAAADIVGKKYLEPQVFRVLRSQKYRAILRKLADSKSGFNMEFVRKDLLQRASTDEKRVLDNFLRRMKALGVIHPAPDGGPGSYESLKCSILLSVSETRTSDNQIGIRRRLAHPVRERVIPRDLVPTETAFSGCRAGACAPANSAEQRRERDRAAESGCVCEIAVGSSSNLPPPGPMRLFVRLPGLRTDPLLTQ